MVREIPQEIPVNTGRPVEKGHGGFRAAGEGLRVVRSLQQGDILAAETRHLLGRRHTVTAYLTCHSVELILELPDEGLCREEDGLGHTPYEKVIIAAAVCYQVHGNGASTCRGTMNHHMVGISAKLRASQLDHQTHLSDKERTEVIWVFTHVISMRWSNKPTFKSPPPRTRSLARKPQRPTR